MLCLEERLEANLNEMFSNLMIVYLKMRKVKMNKKKTTENFGDSDVLRFFTSFWRED